MRLRFAVLGIVAFAALAPPPLRAETLPDAAELRARVAAAAQRAPSERETIVFTSGGASGSRVVFHRGIDFRSITHEGPLHVEAGRYRNEVWHQNENGLTILDHPDPGQASREALSTTVSRTTEPVDGYVIAVLNAARNGSKEYIDGATWRVVRRETIAATGTTVTTYDDFRTVDGSTHAWHWTSADGHPENAAEYRIVAYDAAPVSDSEVSIPPNRRVLVQFPPDRKTVGLPVRFANDRMYVRILVRGRGLDFLLDTGAGGITLDSDVARELGLRTVDVRSTAANAGRYAAARAIVPEMKVGPLVMRDVFVTTIPPTAPETPDTKIVGLLGYDFIAGAALHIDYEHQTVTATLPDAFEKPTGAGTIPLDVRLGTGQPRIDLRVNGALGERFMVDTGAQSSLLVFDYFARRHHEELPEAVPGVPSRHFFGIGGVFEAKPYRLRTVVAGRLSFETIGYVVTAGRAYAGNYDGLIGSRFLHYFDIFTDYTNSRIYLVPNAAGREVFHSPEASL